MVRKSYKNPEFPKLLRNLHISKKPKIYKEIPYKFPKTAIAKIGKEFPYIPKVEIGKEIP